MGNRKTYGQRGLKYLLLSLFCMPGSFFTLNAQQILWAKMYPLAKSDAIHFIVQDAEGNMYAGGSTYRKALNPGALRQSIIYKLNPDGDTLYSKFLGHYGDARSAIVDPYGIIHIAINTESMLSDGFRTAFVSMTPDGFIFKRDSVSKYMTVNHSMLAKDSSWILVGQKNSDLTPNWQDMFFQRIQKDGTIDPYISLNPNHPDCGASRVEQLPNGKILVSGQVGSRIASYEMDEWGLNPVFKQWYQTPDLSFLYTGHVSRINSQRYMIGAEGGPCIVGQYDSLLNKYWLKKDVGTQIPPQAMTDGSVVFGYLTSIGPPNPFYRLGPDSSTIWYISIKDSLIARGINNAVRISCFTYFEDQSAVVAGVVQNPATSLDPIFIKISNVGTPVTSLSKPKRGPLKNETLAPWPNPTGGTLYLKQHFDKAEVHFYSLSGKEVGVFIMKFGQPIDVSDFGAGLYLYRAVIDGKSYSGKVIKQ